MQHRWHNLSHCALPACGGAPTLAAAWLPSTRRVCLEILPPFCHLRQAFVREEIAGFVPKPEDLDYPARLQRQQQQQPPAAAAEAAEAANGGAAPGPDGAAAGGEPGGAVGASGELYAAWYPPVQRTLLLLSKLYRGVDQRIFNGLAHEAVLAATAAVQEGARQILKVPLCAAAASPRLAAAGC